MNRRQRRRAARRFPKQERKAVAQAMKAGLEPVKELPDPEPPPGLSRRPSGLLVVRSDLEGGSDGRRR